MLRAFNVTDEALALLPVKTRFLFALSCIKHALPLADEDALRAFRISLCNQYSQEFLLRQATEEEVNEHYNDVCDVVREIDEEVEKHPEFASHSDKSVNGRSVAKKLAQASATAALGLLNGADGTDAAAAEATAGRTAAHISKASGEGERLWQIQKLNDLLRASQKLDGGADATTSGFFETDASSDLREEAVQGLSYAIRYEHLRSLPVGATVIGRDDSRWIHMHRSDDLLVWLKVDDDRYVERSTEELARYGQ